MPEFEACAYPMYRCHGVAIRQCQAHVLDTQTVERVYFKPTDAYFGSEQFA